MPQNPAQPKIALDWPQSAPELLRQAERNSNLVTLILAGASNPRSWLIAEQIVPMLRDKQFSSLEFRRTDSGTRSASLIPLPDGSAFACNTLGIWSALTPDEALDEIQYLGFKFAPGDRWLDGFEAQLVAASGDSPLTPLALAQFWQLSTGSAPKGFESDALDNLQAYGLQAIDTIFQKKGRLGL